MLALAGRRRYNERRGCASTRFSIGFTLGGLSCLDPVAVRRFCDERGYPTDSFWGQANRYTCWRHMTTGTGTLLMSRANIDQLPKDSLLSLYVEGTDSVSGTTANVTFPGIVFLHAEAVTPSYLGAPDQVYLVQIADRRWLYAGIPIDRGYNLRQEPNGTYWTNTLNSGVAWTWNLMVQDIWNAVGTLGTYPGLPITPDGTPENFGFWGRSAYASLGLVLDRLRCILIYNPILDTFTIAGRGQTDSQETAAEQANFGLRIWDEDPQESGIGRFAAQTRVHFWRSDNLPLGDYSGGNVQFLGQSPYYTVDTPTNLTGAQSGTYVLLYDDEPAWYDSAGNLINGTALTARAQDRTTAYVNDIQGSQKRRHITYGLPVFDAGLLPGTLIQGTSWYDVGTGYKCEIMTGPGETRVEPPPELFPEFIPVKILGSGLLLGLSGTISSGNPQVTGLASTANLLMGQAVSGPGIPPGATILSVDSGSQVTLTANATLSATETVSFSGVLSNLSGTISSGNPQVTGLASTANLLMGQAVSGPGIPPGATILSVDSGSQVTLTANATLSATETVSFSKPMSAGNPCYAWQEQVVNTNGQWSAKPHGRVGSTSINPAFERMLNNAVPIGTQVLLWRGFLNNSTQQQEWIFEHCCKPSTTPWTWEDNEYEPWGMPPGQPPAPPVTVPAVPWSWDDTDNEPWPILPTVPPSTPSKYLDYYRNIGATTLETWFSAVSNGSPGSGLNPAGNSTLWALYLVVPQTITLDRMAIHCGVSGSAGDKIRLGIYAAKSDTDLYPGKLVLDAGEIVLTSTGALSLTINQTLSPGLYYIVAFYPALGGGVIVTMTSGITAPLGVPSSLGNSIFGYFDNNAVAYGALPDPFPSVNPDFITGTTMANNVPFVGLRRSG